MQALYTTHVLSFSFCRMSFLSKHVQKLGLKSLNTLCRRRIFIYLFIYLLHGLYRTLSHSQSEESQVRGGHKSVSEIPAVKFSF